VNEVPAEHAMTTVDLTANPPREPARPETSVLALALRRLRNEVDHPRLAVAGYESKV